jgi:hypothetical protein
MVNCELPNYIILRANHTQIQVLRQTNSPQNSQSLHIIQKPSTNSNTLENDIISIHRLNCVSFLIRRFCHIKIHLICPSPLHHHHPVHQPHARSLLRHLEDPQVDDFVVLPLVAGVLPSSSP